jgi:arylsulfatase A-like enzyme
MRPRSGSSASERSCSRCCYVSRVPSTDGLIGPRTRGFACVAAVLLATLSMSAGGCSRPTAALDGYNLLLVNIDTLRADHLGCYGYERSTSPFLDSFCRAGVVFERAISNSSYTRESVAALFTGRLPSPGGSTGWNAVPGRDAATLAEILGAAGYATALFSNTVMLRRPGFDRGFDTAQHLSTKWSSSGEGRRLSDRVVEHVDRRLEEPFFIYLHYLDPHAPYRPRSDALASLGMQPHGESVALYEEVVPELARLRSGGFGPGDPRFEDLVARYDAEIRTTDAALRALVEGLERQGVLDRTLIIVTADHGEEFLEHDYVEHGWTLYDEVIRVPLIFHAPGVIEPARTRVGASHVDIVPTVLDLLGVDVATEASDGRRLFDYAAGGLAPTLEDRAQIAELILPERQILRAVVTGRWKYITSHQSVPAGERSAHDVEAAVAGSAGGSGPVIREELYDLDRDPGERRNLLLAGDDSEAARVRARLARQLHDLRARSAAETTTRLPGKHLDVSPEDRAHLETLGYLDADESE